MGRFVRWFQRNVLFVSWHRHWKGAYLHFLPRYTVRVYLWNVDWWRKGGFGGYGNLLPYRKGVDCRDGGSEGEPESDGGDPHPERQG